MEKYGFVYLWFDKKRNMFYIGSHWGTETDGYICSSNWMRDAYRYRPNTFKRRIISKIYTNRSDLLLEEYKFLSMIKEEELGVRYYNVKKHHPGHWSTDEAKRQKMIDVNTGKTHTKETRQKMSEAKKGKPSNSPTKFAKGQTPWNKNTKGAQTAWNKGLPKEQSHLYGKPKSEETKRKISEAQKGKPRKSGMEGKKHSEATKEKIRMTKRLNKNKNMESSFL